MREGGGKDFRDQDKDAILTSRFVNAFKSFCTTGISTGSTIQSPQSNGLSLRSLQPIQDMQRSPK